MGLFATGNDGKRVFYKTKAEIELMRNANLVVSKTLAHVASILKPGVTGKDIDKSAEEFIRDHGGRPAFKGYNGFPASLCVSYNDIVVHGIPSQREFKETDVVSVDCGVELEGFYGDAAFTFALLAINSYSAKKHKSIGLDSNFITISSELKGKVLLFSVSNSTNTISTTLKHENGIGLQNVERRLNLLYEGKHKLKSKNEKNIYTVELELILD